MASKRATAGAPNPLGPPVLPRANVSVEHLQILLQRFESLVSSIVALKDEIAVVPGINEWPALLHRYTNLLSHAYSLSSSLVSASPHFLPSQLASFNKVLESEARNSNLYANDAPSSTLFGTTADPLAESADGVRATADGLPELSFYDANNPLPLLLAHPVLPIAEDRLNFLGALLRTAPEPNILQEENGLVEIYDSALAELQSADDGNTVTSEGIDTKLDHVQQEILQHDILALRALRTWYHIEQMADEDGNTLNFKERLPRDEDDDDDEEKDDDDDDDEDMDEEDATLQMAINERKHKKTMEESTWSADQISALLHGHAPRA